MAVGCIEPVLHDLPGGIELWRVDLDRYRYDPDAAIFSADERSRAERFLFGEDRRRFLAAHHALRHVLGRALGREPGALAFEADAQGKPRLLAAPGLEFNLSHSVHECLIGTSTRRPIGVDVEVMQPVVDADALARRHFTPSELEQWERAPAASRERVFLQGWTRKEACLKAVGVGLSAQPRRIEVGCDSGARTVFAELGPCRVAIELVSVSLEGAAIGAVAFADAAA
jgi:4'-phosphopantetheinyl transferase